MAFKEVDEPHCRLSVGEVEVHAIAEGDDVDTFRVCIVL